MKTFIIMFCTLIICSCKQNTEADEKTAPVQSQKNEASLNSGDLNETGSRTEVAFQTEEAAQIHEAYLELKAALVNTDAADAAEVAKEFRQMLGTVMDSGPIASLKTDLEDISKTEESQEQRKAFENVSKNVESYLSDKITSGMLIKQYCPMAFDGKGAYWLSDSKEIRNPYYGDKMLKCGVVDKEIQ